MDSDDGTQAFGELGQSESTAVHWDTPEWREAMERRYAHVHERVEFNADLNRWISIDPQDGWATG